MSTYTVYALYYAEMPKNAAIKHGFIGSCQNRYLNRTLSDHLKRRDGGWHTNKNIQSSGDRQLYLYVIASKLSLDECNKLLKTLRPNNGMGWNITSASRNTTERHTGMNRQITTKLRISAAMTGKNRGTHTEEHNKAISEGKLKYFRPANVYDYVTGKLIAENISIPAWCRENGYSKGLLYLTLNSDFTKPHHHQYNKYHYREIYARWYIA